MKKRSYKKLNQNKIQKSLIAEETKHNHIIPDRIKKKLSKGGKRSFQPLKKKKKSCDKKKAYFTLSDANQVITRRQAEDPGLYLRPYKCDSCKWYHLTSQTEEESIKREQMFSTMTEQNRTQKRKHKKS